MYQLISARKMSLICLVFALFFSASSAEISYKESREPRDITLIYYGYDEQGPRDWKKEKLLYYLIYYQLDINAESLEIEYGSAQDVFFDTVLFMYRKSSRGHLFESGAQYPFTDKQDWLECLDRLFAPNLQLRALDLASILVSDLLNIPFKAKVIITLPYPDVRQRNFGSLSDSSPSLDFSTTDTTRLQAISWFVDETLDRWNKAAFHKLELIGFYWFNESHTNLRDTLDIPPDRAPHDDFNLMKATARLIHDKKIADRNLTLSWIPYSIYGHERQDFCRQWLAAIPSERVDYLMIQPNYFFPEWNKNIGDLHTTLNNARNIGAGIEIEFDERIITEPDLSQRLHEYLDGVRNSGEYYKQTYIGYYQGLQAVRDIATSRDNRNLYEDLYSFIRSRRF